MTTSYTGVYNVAGFPGEEHRAGQWVFNNGDGNTSQWWAIDPSGSRVMSISREGRDIGLEFTKKRRIAAWVLRRSDLAGRVFLRFTRSR